MEISTKSISVDGSTCLYISTKGTGVHRFTSTDYSTVKAVIRGRTNEYDLYGRYEPKLDTDTDVVEKVRRGISYAYSLKQGS